MQVLLESGELREYDPAALSRPKTSKERIAFVSCFYFSPNSQQLAVAVNNDHG